MIWLDVGHLKTSVKNAAHTAGLNSKPCTLNLEPAMSASQTGWLTSMPLGTASDTMVPVEEWSLLRW